MVTLDRGSLQIAPAVRVSLVATGVLAVALATDQMKVAVAPAIGALFLAVLAPLDTDRRVAITLIWAVWWTSLSLFVGALVADFFWLHLLAGAIVAFLAGFAGAISARAANLGLISLVVFVIWSGSPDDLETGVIDTLGFAAGGILITILMVIPGLAHRGRAPRRGLAMLLSGLAWSSTDTIAGISSPVHATHEQQLVDLISRERLSTGARQWLDDLAHGAHRLRIALFALGARAPDEVTLDYLRAAQDTCRRVAFCITWPGRGHRALAASVERLHAIDMSRQPDTTARDYADEATAQLERLAAAVTRPWPTFRPAVATASSLPGLITRFTTTRKRVVSQARIDNIHLRHGIRLAFTITVATAIAEVLDLPHSYWLPLTVAWVSKPALADTTSKLVARTVGTIIGVVIIASLLELLHPPEWLQVIVLGISAAVVIAFMVPNYTLTVIGMTMFVFLLFHLAGESVTSSFLSRAAATIMGAAVVFAAAIAWPTRSSARLAASLKDYAEAMAAYSKSVLSEDRATWDETRLRVIGVRTAAAEQVIAAGREPGRHAIPPATSYEVLSALQTAAAETLATELRGPSANDQIVIDPVFREFTALGHRLQAVDAGDGITARSDTSAATGSESPDEVVRHPIHRAVTDAHRSLDAAARSLP